MSSSEIMKSRAKKKPPEDEEHDCSTGVTGRHEECSRALSRRTIVRHAYKKLHYHSVCRRFDSVTSRSAFDQSCIHAASIWGLLMTNREFTSIDKSVVVVCFANTILSTFYLNRLLIFKGFTKVV